MNVARQNRPDTAVYFQQIFKDEYVQVYAPKHENEIYDDRYDTVKGQLGGFTVQRSVYRLHGIPTAITEADTIETRSS